MLPCDRPVAKSPTPPLPPEPARMEDTYHHSRRPNPPSSRHAHPPQFSSRSQNYPPPESYFRSPYPALPPDFLPGGARMHPGGMGQGPAVPHHPPPPPFWSVRSTFPVRQEVVAGRLCQNFWLALKILKILYIML